VSRASLGFFCAAQGDKNIKKAQLKLQWAGFIVVFLCDDLFVIGLGFC